MVTEQRRCRHRLSPFLLRQGYIQSTLRQDPAPEAFPVRFQSRYPVYHVAITEHRLAVRLTAKRLAAVEAALWC